MLESQIIRTNKRGVVGQGGVAGGNGRYNSIYLAR